MPSPTPAPTVHRVPVEQILDLRHRVLRAGLPPSSAQWDGDHDPDTTHFAALVGQQIIGCATLLHRPWQGAPAWQLRGMAVEEARRGQGVGRLLLAAVEQAAASSGPNQPLWCNARVTAVDFYRKYGWQTVGEVFLIDHAGAHYRMVKE